MASEKEIDIALGSLDVAYPNHMRQYTGPAASLARKMYHRILSDIDGVVLESAVMQWLSMAKPFHPSPGELRDLCLSLVTRDEKSADEAWTEVHDAIRKIGSYRTPTWSSERIAKTVDAFGWYDLCMTETDNLSVIRSQFMRIYQAQVDRYRNDALMLPAVKSNLQQLKAAKVSELIGSTAKRLSSGR